MRYAPPRAAVADVADASVGTQPVRAWPASGRLGRLRLFAWNTVLYVALLAALFVVALVLPRDGTLLLVLTGAAYVAYIAFFWSLLVQRSHDMGISGWWSVLNLIPLVYLYWQFKRGTPGVNAWGAPPEPNSAAVKAVAWIAGILVVLVIGFSVLAGGYAGYTAREAAKTQTR